MSTSLMKYNPVEVFSQQLEVSKHVGKMIVQSGKWAKDWNEATTGIIVMYAMDLGIHPVTACIDGFDVIQGKIQMKPKMMSALIRKSGHSIQFIQNDNKACVIKGRRKDTGDECTVSFSYEDAKAAKLTGKENYSAWTADMFYNRAMGRLGRMLFADVIGGAYTDGEIEDIQHRSKPEEMQQAEVEIMDKPEPVKAKALASPQNQPTIDDLLAAVQKSLVITIEELGDFVNHMAVDVHETTPAIIIASALSKEDQLNKFIRAIEKHRQDSLTAQPEET